MLTVSREPNDSELREALAFLDVQIKSYSESGNAMPAQTALVDFAQVLLGLNEFVYIE